VLPIPGHNTNPFAPWKENLAAARVHLRIGGKAGSKPARSVINERSRFVAQASSLQPSSHGWLRYVRNHRQSGDAPRRHRLRRLPSERLPPRRRVSNRGAAGESITAAQIEMSAIS
jgi:hypothetical protein